MLLWTCVSCPGLWGNNKQPNKRINESRFQWDLWNTPEPFRSVYSSAQINEQSKKHHSVSILQLHTALLVLRSRHCDKGRPSKRSLRTCEQMSAAFFSPVRYSSYLITTNKIKQLLPICLLLLSNKAASKIIAFLLPPKDEYCRKMCRNWLG